MYVPRNVKEYGNDFFSETWPRLKLYIERQVEYLRDRLEVASTWDEASELKGQIKAFRKLLALEKETIEHVSEK